MSEDQMTVPLPRSFSVSRMLASHVRNLGCEFLVNGTPHPPVAILAEDAFLPIVAVLADIEFRALLGLAPGVVFKSTEDSLFGASVKVDDLTPDMLSVFRGLIYIDTARRVFGLEKGRQIECAPLFETYKSGLMARIPVDAAPKLAAQTAPLNR